MDLYITFVIFTKAFNIGSRDSLWTMMAKFNCPLRFIVIVRHFYDGMQALGKTHGGYYEPQDGEKALTPFSMMFSEILTDASRTGFTTKYCFDSKTVCLKRLIANLKVLQVNVLVKLLFEDDLAEHAIMIK